MTFLPCSQHRRRRIRHLGSWKWGPPAAMVGEGEGMGVWTAKGNTATLHLPTFLDPRKTLPPSTESRRPSSPLHPFSGAFIVWRILTTAPQYRNSANTSQPIPLSHVYSHPANAAGLPTVLAAFCYRDNCTAHPTRQCGRGCRYRPNMLATVAWTAANVLSSMPAYSLKSACTRPTG
jgi:hypothetical protein